MRLKKSALRVFGLVAGAVVLAGAFALRLYMLHAADLSFDEVATVFVAHRPILEVLRYIAGAAREHPPLYYLGMSLWIQAAGTSEYAIRYPSALIGLLAAASSFRLGHRLFGRTGAWLALLVFALAPLSLWAARNGRMYSLVMLLSLAIMASWIRWIDRPTARNWLIFTGLSLAGAMTHYFLVLLWPAQALLLLAFPQQTRAIRRPWLATLAAAGTLITVFVALSPGVQGMALDVLRRFPVRAFRKDDLRLLAVSLYLGGFDPQLAWLSLIGIAMTAAGWALSCWRDRLIGALLIVWGLVPLTILHFVPEQLEARYLMPIVPGLLMGIVALLDTLRPRLLQAVGLAAVVGFSVWRLPIHFETPDTTFSSRMRLLNIAASPDDALIMNGPWPRLLLTYYSAPDNLDVFSVPEAAPPGFSEAVDIPRLEAVTQAYERLWISYGAIHWADPQYTVSRWLAENTYCVFERYGMTLCLPAPETPITTTQDLALGTRLRLLQSSVDRDSAQVGETIRVRLDLEGQGLDQAIGFTLALLDASGTPWAQREQRLGPPHQPSGSILPERWSELSGLWLLPGIPPGDYTLGLRIYGSDIDSGAGATFYGWISLGQVRVLPGGTVTDLLQLLPHHEEIAPESSAGGLRLVGVEPHADRYMHGYPASFHLWWQVGSAAEADHLQVRLHGPELVTVGQAALGPDFYPASAWQDGDVIRQSVSFLLPDQLSPGLYQVQAHLYGQDGTPLPAPRTAAATQDGWYDLFSVTIEARTRRFHPPLLLRGKSAEFGGLLRLEGYTLRPPRLSAGDSAGLTVYWRSLEQTQRVYAVFNHLRAIDGTVVWQEDSWPQAGIYTTNHWLAGEVVAEGYTITLPATLPPGSYTLYTGVYDPATEGRLPGLDDRGQSLLNDEFALFELDITR